MMNRKSLSIFLFFLLFVAHSNSDEIQFEFSLGDTNYSDIYDNLIENYMLTQNQTGHWNLGSLNIYSQDEDQCRYIVAIINSLLELCHRTIDELPSARIFVIQDYSIDSYFDHIVAENDSLNLYLNIEEVKENYPNSYDKYFLFLIDSYLFYFNNAEMNIDFPLLYFESYIHDGDLYYSAYREFIEGIYHDEKLLVRLNVETNSDDLDYIESLVDQSEHGNSLFFDGVFKESFYISLESYEPFIYYDYYFFSIPDEVYVLPGNYNVIISEVEGFSNSVFSELQLRPGEQYDLFFKYLEDE